MPSRLTNLVVDENTLCHVGANAGARVVLFKRGDVKKDEPMPGDVHVDAPLGAPLPKKKPKKGYQQMAKGDPSSFAYVPDKATPSTWKLDISDAEHVGGAVAALGPSGFRGQKVEIPEKDLPAVKARVRSAWKRFHPDAKPGDLPAVLKSIGAMPEIPMYTADGSADDDDDDAGPPNFAEELLERRRGDILCEMSDYTGALCDVIEDAVDDPATLNDVVRAALDDFGQAVMAALSDWTSGLAKSSDVRKVGAKISAERMKRLKDAHAALGQTINEQDPSYHPGGDPQKESTDMTDAEKKAADEKAALEKKQADEKAAKSNDAVEKALDERIAKAVDAAVVPLRKENETLRKDLDAAQKTVGDERERRETLEVEHLVKTDLQGYPGSTEEKVAIVKSIRKALPEKEAKDAVDKMRAAAATLRKSDTFREIGTDAAGGVAGGSADQELEQLAKAKLDEVRKSGDTKMTFAKAYSMACDQHPDLYKRYIEERRDAVH